MNSKIASSFMWRLAERFGAQIVNLIVSIIIARILTPIEYGQVAMVAIFIEFALVLFQNGLNTALIQNKRTTNDDYSSALWTNILLSFVAVITLFFLSPVISDYYGYKELNDVLRVLSLKLIFDAASTIYSARFERRLDFKSLFLRGIIANILSGLVGILLAVKGLGVWALVFQQLSSSIIIFVILFITSHWIPCFRIDTVRTKELLTFGWKVIGAKLLDTVNTELRSLMIGKKYDAASLAYYDKGKQFPGLIAANATGALGSVLLPVFSAVQGETETLRSYLRRSIRLVTVLVFPLLAVLAAIAKPLVTILLTDTWLPCVIYLKLICAVYMFQPLYTINAQALNAIGKSDIYLKTQVIKKIISLTLLFISLPYGISIIIIGSVISEIISCGIDIIIADKYIGYKSFTQFVDIVLPLLISLVMYVLVNEVGRLIENPYLLLFSQMIFGIAIYCGLIPFCRPEFVAVFKNKLFDKKRNSNH